MSNITPEVTDALVEFLYARTAHGDEKYGTPLLPFDGRDTLMDAIEESSDLLQYLWKRRMENEAIADLLERAAKWQGELIGTILRPGYFEHHDQETERIQRALENMAAKLRADCQRSVAAS